MPLDSAPRHDAGSARGQPEFGPRGYLPERAAKRARKIVLREELSLGWVLASLGAGLALLVAGLAFWLRGGPPAEPFAPLVALEAVPVGEVHVAAAHGADVDVLVVHAPGTLRAFHAPTQEAVWCGDSDRVEGRDGAVWQLDGRRVGGHADSLTPVPVEVHDGVVYAAADAARTPVPASDRGESPRCVDAPV